MSFSTASSPRTLRRQEWLGGDAVRRRRPSAMIRRNLVAMDEEETRDIIETWRLKGPPCPFASGQARRLHPEGAGAGTDLGVLDGTREKAVPHEKH